MIDLSDLRPLTSDLELRTLATWLTGKFDSFDQNEADCREGAIKRLGRLGVLRRLGLVRLLSWLGVLKWMSSRGMLGNPHRRVLLQMVPVTVEGLSEYGYALYVEQAMDFTPTEPYRQRVYLAARTLDGRLVNRIFNFKSRTAKSFFKGADPERLQSLTAECLAVADGCDIRWETETNPRRFIGVGGEGDSCRIDYPIGERTREVAIHVATVLTPDALRSKDQGFATLTRRDAPDALPERVLVFGPTDEEGPYVFKKR